MPEGPAVSGVVAIVAAGGRGARLGADVPKQLLDLRGRSVLQRSIDALLDSGLVALVVVVLPPDLAAEASGGAHVRAEPGRVTVVAGGARRQDSVALGFDAVPDWADIVLVHDAARPFVSRDVIERTIRAAADHGAAIAAVRARDTVKRAALDEGRAVIDATLPREQIFLAQTPQGFRRPVLADAVRLGRGGVEATDEASLVELAGHTVAIVEGDVLNMKITTEADLRLARAVLAQDAAAGGGTRPPAAAVDPGTAPRASRSGPPSPAVRIGLGYDLHRFVAGRPLLLGGVSIPHHQGLAGHSDADAVAHAVTDAVLGAASLGDIGQLFPDTDPRWAGADSLMMLREAVARVHAAGYRVGNVDVTVVAEAPKIGPHRAAIAARVADVLQVDAAAVSVKGKTNEGVDAVGRGEALAVHAVASLLPVVD
jgi:2-C-methyl-D-erythritol 4-phosphate cytidylyltransferase/2-C-methyl-D-erythritol 2,4-cyclodiphosphate synthase